MKIFVIYTLLFCLSLPVLAQEVDLDTVFLKATKGTTNPSLLSFPGPRAELPPQGWDGSPAFPPVVKQSPFGACQSFSMTAFMEYLFWRETGKTLKLSEKQMAHGLLSLMIEAFYNKESGKWERRPSLGYGVAGPMIETVARSGLLPNADYPWGDYESDAGSRSIDVSLFNKVFENERAEYSQDEYRRLLDEAFLSAPPRAFRYSLKGMNFQTGKEEETMIKTPSELAAAAGFRKDRFLVLHNSTPNLTYSPQKPEETSEMLRYFEAQSARYGVRSRAVPAEEIVKAIVASLERRMVVLIALDVWSGSWTDKLVYAGGGGHGVVVTGYQVRDGEVWLKIRNSWGTGMGVGGYNLVKAAHLAPNLYYAIFAE